MITAATAKPGWKPGRIIAAALLAALLANVAATQFVAWRLAYHPALGAPLIGRVYPPWTWIAWQAHFPGAGPGHLCAIARRRRGARPAEP
jgi:type IV secretion system protein VirD4